MIKERDKLLKSYQQENDHEKKELAHLSYKRIRNIVTQKKRVNKSTYFLSYFEKNKNKSSEIWKGIKSLVNIKSSNCNSINLLDKHKNLVNDQKKIVNKFNDYFVTVGSSIANRIPTVTGSYKDYMKKINCANSFYLSPTDEFEIEKLIDTLDINKSTGPNSLPVFILKIMKPFFSKWLCKLINLSLEVFIFPDLLKVAKVTPIHKKDSKLNQY